ncbi:MAG TPA: transketolase C-terminal domain-containing protein, partial [Trueperaceae bacterium]
TALDLGGPKAIRWPRGKVARAANAPVEDWPELAWGSWEVLKDGRKACILAFGSTLAYALEAAEEVPGVGVVNARFAKPLDTELLLALAHEGVPLVTVEDHQLAGGLGSAVAEALVDHGIAVPLRRLGIPDCSVPHGDPKAQHQLLGLGTASILRALQELGVAGAHPRIATDVETAVDAKVETKALEASD